MDCTLFGFLDYYTFTVDPYNPENNFLSHILHLKQSCF